MTPMRPTSRRQAELDAWLSRATDEGVVDLASLRGTMRAPTNLLQQLAEAVLDSNVSVMPEGGLPALRQSWAAFEAQSRNRQIDDISGMVVVNEPLAAYAAAVLGLVSPGRHVAVLEPLPPQVVDVVRRVGGMVRSVSMRPTEWEFDVSEFIERISPQTDLIVVADPNPYSGQYLPGEARQAIVDAAAQMDCVVLVDESARHSVVEGEAPETAELFSALGARCVRVDVPAAAILAQAASAASITGHPDLIGPIRSAASAFGLQASVIAQSVLARRFSDGAAIDDSATLNGIVASGRALLLDGLDDIGVLGLGGPGGWYVPVRAKALYDGPHDIGDALASQAGLAALPLAPFYVEGSDDPYVLFAYLRDGNLLEDGLQRLGELSENDATGLKSLALPAPEDWEEDEGEGEDDYDFEGPNAETGDESEGETWDAVAPAPEPESEPKPKPKPAPDLEDEDARYRAAVAELSRALGGEESVDTVDDEETKKDASAWTDEEPASVVLPFGRLRRDAAAPPENVPTSTSETETESDSPTEGASVFKLSVPDIASPNIRAPEPDSDMSDADNEADDVAPDSSEPEVSGGASHEASSEPSPDDAAPADDGDNANRVKREDRPFFFDDPMV